jgi:hypothetical protein
MLSQTSSFPTNKLSFFNEFFGLHAFYKGKGKGYTAISANEGS